MNIPSDHEEDAAELVYRRAGDETPAEGVVGAVSELTGTPPETMDPLFDAIDPGALNTLCGRDPRTQKRTPRSVSFQFHGCAVAVYGDGRIEVSRLQ